MSNYWPWISLGLFLGIMALVFIPVIFSGDTAGITVCSLAIIASLILFVDLVYLRSGEKAKV